MIFIAKNDIIIISRVRERIEQTIRKVVLKGQKYEDSKLFELVERRGSKGLTATTACELFDIFGERKRERKKEEVAILERFLVLDDGDLVSRRPLNPLI